LFSFRIAFHNLHYTASKPSGISSKASKAVLGFNISALSFYILARSSIIDKIDNSSVQIFLLSTFFPAFTSSIT